MEINKITLEKKVVPSLLYDKDGKKILENVGCKICGKYCQNDI